MNNKPTANLVGGFTDCPSACFIGENQGEPNESRNHKRKHAAARMEENLKNVVAAQVKQQEQLTALMQLVLKGQTGGGKGQKAGREGTRGCKDRPGGRSHDG
ncbi:hypothetical protein DIPPA_31750 [Diplonema papillatum]|nr:hypothetical protein DIPPA_25477 [Diplonema papillatum]KAJ9459453.1 hypothetical protein DIPPA_31750 [Diplonema papillatum]